MNIEKYKAILKKNKMTYEDLAIETGLSLGCIKRIMAGIAQYPRIDTIEAIENALGLNETHLNEIQSDEDRELVSLFHALTPEYQAVALTTLRSWAGVPAVNTSKKKA